MSFFRHLLLCLWKTWLQKLRHPVSSCTELLLPVALVGVWVFLYTSLGHEDVPDLTHECSAATTVDASTRQDFLYLPRALGILNRKLALVGPPELRNPFFAHLNETYPGLSSEAVNALGCRFDSNLPGFKRSLNSVPPIADAIMTFDTEAQLDAHVIDPNYGKGSSQLIYAAVVWEQGPPHWNYTIRMNKTATPPNDIATDAYAQGLQINTQDLYVSYDPALDQFYQWPTDDLVTVPGFVPIQLAVDKFILRAKEQPIASLPGLEFTNATLAQLPGMLAVWNCSFNLPFDLDAPSGLAEGIRSISTNAAAAGDKTGMDPLTALGKALSFLQSHSLSPQQATLVPFPTAAFISTTFYSIAENVFSLSFVLFFFFPVSQMISGVVHEKESRIKEGMRMMGIPSTALTTAWYITYGLAFFVSAYGCAALASKSMFSNSDPWVVCFVFWLFGAAATAEAFLISVFFSRAKVASAVGTIVFLASFFPYYAVNDPKKSLSAKIGACILGPVAFGLDLQVLGNLEASGIGLHWSTVNLKVQGFDAATGMIMMAVDAVLYTAIALYLEQILPSEFGVPRPWYFPCTSKFWGGACAGLCGSVGGLRGSSRRGGRGFGALTSAQAEVETASGDISLPGMDVGDNGKDGRPLLDATAEDDPAYADTRNFEPLGAERRALKAANRCVTARNLQKHFQTPDGVRKAVDGVNLDVFQGEIFALLGHNGAGKSTTMSMLTGLIPMTAGHAEAFGLDTTGDMDELRQILGVCPQHDVLWPELTVTEHLTFFAAAKGVAPGEVAAAVEETIKEVGLTEKRDVQSQALSGGMKRKLSVGIALIGGSKLVVLDEPTSGMDPYSRRSTWNILLSSKSDRAIILSTHFLDEADLLGDRVAIMAAGRVRCCGSSMFLKKRYGVGYNLTLNKADEHVDATPIKDLIRRHVPDVKLLSDVGAEIAFQVPTEACARFPVLFEELEATRDAMGVRSFSIGATTLEEVFLRVAEEEHHGAMGATQKARDASKAVGHSDAGPGSSHIGHLADAAGADDDDAGYLPPDAASAAAASSSGGSGGGYLVPGGATTDTKATAGTGDGDYLGKSGSNWDFGASPDASARGTEAAAARAAKEAKAAAIPSVTHAQIRANARSEGKGVFWQHFRALFQKRLRYALRDMRAAVFQLLIPVVALLAGLLILKLNPVQLPPAIEFNTSLLNFGIASGVPGAAPWSTVMQIPVYDNGQRARSVKSTTPIDNATMFLVSQASLDAAYPIRGNYTLDKVTNCSALLQANIWLWDPTDCRADSINASGIPFLAPERPFATTSDSAATLHHGEHMYDAPTAIRAVVEAMSVMSSRIGPLVQQGRQTRTRAPSNARDALATAALPSSMLPRSEARRGQVLDAIASAAGVKSILAVGRAAATLWGAKLGFPTPHQHLQQHQYLQQHQQRRDHTSADTSALGASQPPLRASSLPGSCSSGELPHPLDHAKQFSEFLLQRRKSGPRGASQYAALNVTAFEIEAQPGSTINSKPVVGNAGMVLYHNTTANHIIPTMLNIFSNALWRTKSQAGNSSSIASIRANSNPIPFTEEELSIQAAASSFVAVLFITLAFAFIPASFAVFVVREKEVSAKHQQLISGVSIPAYWVATYCWDVSNYAVPCILSIVLVAAFDVRELLGDATMATVLLFVLYGASVAAFTYCMSYCFTSHSTAQIVTLVLNLLCMILLIASFIMQQIDSTCSADRALRYVYRLLPGYSLGNGLLQLSLLKQLAFLNTDCSKGTANFNPLDAPVFEPFSADVAGAPIAYMAIECVVYFAMAILIDILLSFPAIRARVWPDKNKPIETFDEDEDVRTERGRVDSKRAESDVIVLDNLRKVYGGEKTAIKQLSFGIGGGQIFGFLGCNGAGKTTTMKILTGDIIPTQGTARLAGLDVLTNQLECRRMLGYCPQFDALLDLLTVREHLELYSRIKSVPDDQVEGVVRTKMEEFDLVDFEFKLAGSLSGGNKRKLSVAIALISEPPLVVLDEPSTGVDPVARRFMWDVIARYLGSSKTVILVTHSMEEVEALCNNVGIMVGGRMRCLGSITHLKDRFGKGYMVEIKLDEPEEGHSGRVLDLAAEAGTIVDRDGASEAVEVAGEPSTQRHARLGAGSISAGRAKELCEVLGDPTRAAMLHPKSSGWALAADMASTGFVNAASFAEWWAFESLGAHLHHFMTHTFPDATLVERHGEFFRYSIAGSDAGARSKLPLSRIFRALEAARERLRISTYSLSQTTLEAVFNSFAAQQDEETGTIRGMGGAGGTEEPRTGRTHSRDALELDEQLDDVETEIGDSLLGAVAGMPGFGSDMLTGGDDAEAAGGTAIN